MSRFGVRTNTESHSCAHFLFYYYLDRPLSLRMTRMGLIPNPNGM